MVATKVFCPHCKVSLKSTKPIPAGKRITCVKCQKVFTFSPEMAVSSTGESHLSSFFFLAESQPGTIRSPMAGIATETLAPPSPPKVEEKPTTVPANGDETSVKVEEKTTAATSGPRPKPQAPLRPLVVVSRRRKSRAGLLVALALLLLISAGVGAAIYFNNRHQAPDPDPNDAAQLDKIFLAQQKPLPTSPPPQNNATHAKKAHSKPQLAALEKGATPALAPAFAKNGQNVATAKIQLPAPQTADVLPVAPPLIVTKPIDQKRIDDAIDKGVQFLKENIKNTGTWLPSPGQHEVGYAALPALALLECKVPPTDPVVQQAAAFVRKHAGKLIDTYDLGLVLLFLDRLGDPKDEKLIKTMALRLVAGQSAAGGWGYECPVLEPGEGDQLMKFLVKHRPKIDLLIPLEASVREKRPKEKERTKPASADVKKKTPADNLSARIMNLPIVAYQRTNDKAVDQTARDDNSNSLFGLLALWAARRHGIPTELPLSLAAQRYKDTQRNDGGWGYVIKSPTKNTMTCVGLLGLAMGHGAMAEAVANASSKGAPPRPPLQDPYISDALKALNDYIDGDFEKRGLEGRVELYYLWTLERVGILYNQKSFGHKDWYQYGAKFILDCQLNEGGWKVHYDPPVDTSFALLFLKRSNLVADLTQNIQLYLAIPNAGAAPIRNPGQIRER